MRKIFLLTLLIACPAQAQLTLTGAGSTKAASAAAFSGPGDVVGSATAFWGMQAYTAAYASSLGKAVNACDAGDAHCGDLSFDATGALVDSTIPGAAGPCSSITCTVKTAYDQLGNAAANITNATEANRPRIQFSCQGGHACMTFTATQFLAVASWNAGVNQPWTISGAFIDTGTSTGTGGAFIQATTGGGAGAGCFSNDGAANILETYAGTALTGAATNGAWFVGSCVGNGASSDANVNGTAHTGAANTRALDGFVIRMGSDGTGASGFVGKIGAIGVWPVAFSGGNSTSMSANMHTFWGF